MDFNEDHNDYDVFWRDQPITNASSLQQHFTYTSASESVSIPVMGKFFYFSGGGYIVDLPRDVREAQDLLLELQENAWLNHDTKGKHFDLCTIWVLWIDVTGARSVSS